MKVNHSQQTLESMSQAVWYNRWTLNKFKNYLKGEILEVGCGIGNFTETSTKYGSVWAIDINKNHLTKTKNLVNNKAKIGFGDIEKGIYFFGEKKFDCIVCINVLEHIKEDRTALKNIFNLLDEKGYLILLVPAHQFLFGEIDKSIGHLRRYDKNQIVNKLKEAGFSIIFSRRLNFLGGLGWWVAGKIFGDGTVTEGNIKVFNLLAPFILSFEDFVEPPFGTSILIVAKK